MSEEKVMNPAAEAEEEEERLHEQVKVRRDKLAAPVSYTHLTLPTN